LCYILNSEEVIIIMDAFNCPHCSDLFVLPVVVPCGHSFCADCMCGFFQENTTACPLCKESMDLKLSKRNFQAEKMMEFYVEKVLSEISLKNEYDAKFEGKKDSWEKFQQLLLPPVIVLAPPIGGGSESQQLKVAAVHEEPPAAPASPGPEERVTSHWIADAQPTSTYRYDSPPRDGVHSPQYYNSVYLSPREYSPERGRPRWW
jgi:hypothetical protein